MKTRDPLAKATLAITITEIPEDQSPASLARAGEAMNLEANGPELNPSPQAWMRAGIAAAQILRSAQSKTFDGEVWLAMLVCHIAGNAEPDWDDSTPERAKLIGDHVSYAHEWMTGSPKPTPSTSTGDKPRPSDAPRPQALEPS